MSAPTIQRWLLESVGIIVVYWLAAYAVIEVQSGMGAPNLLWLPAGIALSAALIRGPMAVAPIFIATISFHFYSFFAEVSSSLQAWAATMVTAFGSTLQAVGTAWLLRRCIRDFQVSSVRDALIFTLCAAVGCTIAASVGTLALLSQNKIGIDSISLSWLTWWVGDLSGMLVVAPLVLLVHYWRQGRREWSLLSLPIIGLGCSFTLVSAFIVKHLDHDGRVNEFQSSGVVMGQALQRTLELSRRDLMASHTLFYNLDINRKEFQVFASTVLAQNSLIQSLTWIPRVTHAQRARFESEARRQGAAGYRIYDRGPDGTTVPATESAEYLPILMVEPEGGSLQVPGFNLLSDPLRRDALILSRFTNEPRATRLIPLVQGGKAVVVYWPLYRNEYQSESNARDSDNLRGYVGMGLAIGKLAEETLHPFESRQAETWLLDVTSPNNVEVLYHHIDGEQDTSAIANTPQLAQLHQGVYQETTHSFAGREWLLISRPRVLDGNLKANGQFIAILAGGFCLTFLLAIYMIGRQRSEYALHERDDRLMNQNAVLTQLARYGLVPEEEVNKQLQELLATAARTLKVERVSLWLLEDEGRSLNCKLLFTSSSGEFSDGLVLEAASVPTYFATLSQGRGFAANDAVSDPRTSEFADNYLRPLGITSMMDVPVRIGGKPAGVICHEHIGPARVWAQDEQNFAASIGDLASLLIESDKRRHAEKALQESHQALERKVEERTEELRSANERLRQLDHLKSMFVASMSHELRTPLNAIIGFTDILLLGFSGPLTDAQQENLKQLDNSARHLLDLISDVIDVSKIEAGYADVYAETFPLNQLIDEALAAIQPQRMEKGLGLEIEASGTIALNSDRQRLLQCVLNLLSNAIKYSEHGTLKVRLKEQPDRVIIQIEDQGIGISAEAMNKLFQPFERIDTHLRIKTPGTGLGLYLTRKIATELLHGDVSVISTPGKGSTFTLWVPHSLPALDENEKQP